MKCYLVFYYLFVLFRSFENPQPGRSEIVQAVDSLRLAVEGQLKSKSRLPLTIDFPSHILRYLFKGKGEVTGGGFILMRGHLAEDIFHRTGTSVLTHLVRDTKFAIL